MQTLAANRSLGDFLLLSYLAECLESLQFTCHICEAWICIGIIGEICEGFRRNKVKFLTSVARLNYQAKYRAMVIRLNKKQPLQVTRRNNKQYSPLIHIFAHKQSQTKCFWSLVMK